MAAFANMRVNRVVYDVTSKPRRQGISALDAEAAPMISMISFSAWSAEMPDLLVRGVDEELVRALKERAGAHGRSAEAEHRAILAAALARPKRRSFAEVLASMPPVGLDADFERVEAAEGARGVFD